MYNHCSVPNCESLRKDVKFHVFPRGDYRLKWLDCIDSEILRTLSVDELKKRYVCHKHFEKRFITSKSRLLGNAYPTLFTDEEISSGIPSLHYEDIENTPADHIYARKRHYDHSYARATPRPLGISQQTASSSDSTLLMPSCSKMLNNEDEAQHSIVDVPSGVIQPAAISLHTEKNVVPLHNKPNMPCIKDSTLLMPSSSKTLNNENDSIVDVPSDLVQPAANSSSSGTEKNIVSVLNQPKMPIVKDSYLKSATKRKRHRLAHKVSELSPKCKHMYNEYKKSRKQLNFNARARRAMKFSKGHSFEMLTKNMGEYSKKLFWMQIKMSMKEKKARRFTLEEKIISLSILKQSPKCYKFLKKIFILPSRTTLKKLVAQLNIEPGVNGQIFELIKQEVQTWKEEKRYCSIIFDEMALEPGLTYLPHKDKIAGFVELNERKGEFADHALVFMAKGAIYKWQQPVGFYFCAGATSGMELKTILKKIVTAVGETGLIPIALISDQGAAFQSALKSLQQDTRREQILADENTDNIIALDGFTLSVIYDPPHLIKGLRNNFLTKDILFEDNIAKWSDIVDVYKADCRHAETRLLHKLNDEHIIPEKIKKMKVKNCVRVFSKTMAGALAYTSQFSHYTDGTPVSQSLENTSNLVRFLDNLFDSVNGASIQPKKGRGKDLPRAVTENSRHHMFWREAVVKLKAMKFIVKGSNKHVTVPSLNNWITTLESFMRLWQFFTNKQIKIMRPRYFNSDTIENFFGQVRAYNFRSNNPDCHSFMNTFKSLLITGFIKFHSESYNCEEDNFNQLLKINQLFSSNFSQSDNISCTDNIASSSTDEIVRNTIEEARQERLNVHSRAYTAGWVVRKILLKLKCKNCKDKLTTETTTNIHKWISHKEYKAISQKNLTYPSECAVRSFGEILKETNQYLELNAHTFQISKNIKENMISKYDFSNIACESHQTITTQLFLDITLKLGIFNWCNIINKILRGTDILRLQSRSLPMMQNKAIIKYKKKLKKPNK